MRPRTRTRLEGARKDGGGRREGERIEDGYDPEDSSKMNVDEKDEGGRGRC
jgi:hypothetical protein